MARGVRLCHFVLCPPGPWQTADGACAACCAPPPPLSACSYLPLARDPLFPPGFLPFLPLPLRPLAGRSTATS
eukprot:scaffold5323_cov112-Isochrysis_galbana.AAC.5